MTPTTTTSHPVKGNTRLEKDGQRMKMKMIKVLTVVGLVMMLVCSVPRVAAQDDDEDEDDCT